MSLSEKKNFPCGLYCLLVLVRYLIDETGSKEE